MIFAQLIVCGGTRCMLNDSKNIKEEIIKELNNYGILDQVAVLQTGCFGMCFDGPVVKIFSKYTGITDYFKVNVNDAKRIVEETLVNHKIIEELTIRKR